MLSMLYQEMYSAALPRRRGFCCLEVLWYKWEKTGAVYQRESGHRSAIPHSAGRGMRWFWYERI